MLKSLITVSDFYCIYCGDHLIIQRNDGERREENHIKDFYCHQCGHETGYIEVRDNDHFTSRRFQLLKDGILSYYFETYGYDFLKMLVYIDKISSHEDFVFYQQIIDPAKNMEVLFADYKLLKAVVKHIKSREPIVWKKIRELLKIKTVFIGV